VDVRVIAATNRPPARALSRRGASGRPVLPAQRAEHLPAAAARASERHSAPRAPFIRDLSPSTTAPFRGSRPRRWSCSSSIPGRATCASCEPRREYGRALARPRDRARDLRGRSGKAGTPVSCPCIPGPVVQGTRGGRAELEFILRSLLELKLQVEDLRAGSTTALEAGGARSSGRCPRLAIRRCRGPRGIGHRTRDETPRRTS
jgi:hypothetical protein